MKSNSNDRVLIFLVWYGLGGSTIYVGQYVSFLVKNKYKVYVVCRKKDKGSEYLKGLGAIPIYIHFPFALNFTALDKKNDSAKKRIIDVFKLFGGTILSFFLILFCRPDIVIIGEFCQIPVLLSNYLFNNKSICLFQTSISKIKWKRKVLFSLLKRVTHLVGITDIHTNMLPFRNKISTIPNTFVNLNISGIDLKINYIDSANRLLVLFIGGVSEIKGTKQFVEIAIELLKIRRDLSFVIVGNYHKSFKTKNSIGMTISEYNYNKEVFELTGEFLDDNILFLGEISYVNELLKHTSLLICNNTYSHFSRPIIEAWANKVPVVANKDEFSIYMDHGNDSILFISNNAALSAIMINNLLNSPELMIKIANAGLKNYDTMYSSQSVERKIRALFEL